MATIDKRIGTSGKVSWRVRVRRASGPALVKSFARKSDADEWARSIEHRIDSGEKLPSSEARKRTLADAIDHYLTVTLPRAKRNKNAGEQTRILGEWKELLSSRALTSITSATVAEARDKIASRKSRYGKPIAGGTVNRHLAALSAVLKVTVKEYGWLSKNPVSNVSKFAESKGLERFLSHQERKNLLEACEASPCAALSTIVQLALATGARKGEILGLQWQGVDLDWRVAQFMDTKNGESRTVPLAAPAITAIKEWKENRQALGDVFPGLSGNFDHEWRDAREAAGLPDVRFHDLRHSAAT